jgi:hypothetical protein
MSNLGGLEADEIGDFTGGVSAHGLLTGKERPGHPLTVATIA